jgi:hypothetical protein
MWNFRPKTNIIAGISWNWLAGVVVYSLRCVHTNSQSEGGSLP